MACESIRVLVPLRAAGFEVPAETAVFVLLVALLIESAGFAIGPGVPLVLSSASSAAHLARTRAATSSAALSLRRRVGIEWAVL